MIKFPAAHLFEAKAPMLEDGEEEILYVHPTGEYSCNQLGVLYYDEEKYSLLENINGSYMRTNDKRNISKGTKLKLVYECYKNILFEGRNSPHIYQANANIYDFTEENLILSASITRQEQVALHAVKKEFINKSLERLIQIENRWSLLGVSKEELWTMLVIPYWLIGARKRHDGIKKWGRKITKKRK